MAAAARASGVAHHSLITVSRDGALFQWALDQPNQEQPAPVAAQPTPVPASPKQELAGRQAEATAAAAAAAAAAPAGKHGKKRVRIHTDTEVPKAAGTGAARKVKKRKRLRAAAAAQGSRQRQRRAETVQSMMYAGRLGSSLSLCYHLASDDFLGKAKLPWPGSILRPHALTRAPKHKVEQGCAACCWPYKSRLTTFSYALPAAFIHHCGLRMYSV